MSTVEDRLTDALAARAQLETVDASVLRRHREDVQTAMKDDATTLYGLDDDKFSNAVINASGDFIGQRHRFGVVVGAAAAVLMLIASTVGIARFVHRTAATPAATPPGLFEALRRPQLQSDLGSENNLPQQTVRNSVRVVGMSDGTTYWVGVTEDQRVCFSAIGSTGSSATCTLHGPVSGDALSVELQSGNTEAWLTPDGYNTDDLRRHNFLNLAPNLWVSAAPGIQR